MTTSLSPPDVDATIKLHAEYAGTGREGFGSNRRVRATQFSKSHAEHTRDWTGLLQTEGAQPQKDFPTNTHLRPSANQIYPLSVVDPKYLSDTFEINNGPKFSETRGPSATSNEALSLNERSLVPSTAVAYSAYFPQGPLGPFPFLGTSAENGRVDSDTVQHKALSPLVPSMRSTGTPIYKYGNDTSFVGDSFYVPQHHKSEDEITQSNMKLLDCLERQESISSPKLERQTAGTSTHVDVSDMGHHVSGESTYDGEVKPMSIGTRPTRRRKTKVKDRTLSQPEQDCLEHPRRHKKLSSKKASQPQSDLGEDSSCSSPRHSRNSKSIRQNLTSEQRRANHIGSEKQRRDSIQVLEEELRQVVPVLRSSDFSKAEMLEQAGNWLETLLQGNCILEARLDEGKS